MGTTQSRRSIYCVSDLHTDHDENWAIVQKLQERRDDLSEAVLIVAGDISTDLDVVKQTLTFLKQIFSEVFFCPGNNELRLSRKERKSSVFRHSVEKFHAVIELCNRLGVHTTPRTVLNGSVRIVPLFSWYTPHFEKNYTGDTQYRKRWLDFYDCHWPEHLDLEMGVAQHFLQMNEPHLSAGGEQVTISFSHFLPRAELLPSVSTMMNKTISLVVGVPELDAQIRKLGSNIHVFGHTHMNVDTSIGKVRYVQNAFGHPSERKTLSLQKLSEEIKCIWSSPLDEE